jgi:MSHA biogenesis protein MshQ
MASPSLIDNVQIEGCGSVMPIDHFRIRPSTTAASSCLPNAVTIIAEDASNNVLTDYLDQVDISVSTNHGNWSVNAATNVTIPNPDNDDNGAVSYTYLASDLGVIVLDLTNTHAETLTISVNDPVTAVTSTSVAITYSSNVFVITEDPIQVAGRPMAMNVAMWTDDLAGSGSCGIDTNYNYPAITVDTDRKSTRLNSSH